MVSVDPLTVLPVISPLRAFKASSADGSKMWRQGGKRPMTGLVQSDEWWEIVKVTHCLHCYANRKISWYQRICVFNMISVWWRFGVHRVIIGVVRTTTANVTVSKEHIVVVCVLNSDIGDYMYMTFLESYTLSISSFAMLKIHCEQYILYDRWRENMSWTHMICSL